MSHREAKYADSTEWKLPLCASNIGVRDESVMKVHLGDLPIDSSHIFILYLSFTILFNCFVVSSLLVLLALHFLFIFYSFLHNIPLNMFTSKPFTMHHLK